MYFFTSAVDVIYYYILHILWSTDCFNILHKEIITSTKKNGTKLTCYTSAIVFPFCRLKVKLWHFKWIIWASSRENLSSGFPTMQISNQSPQLQRPARKLKYHLNHVYIMILTKKRITKALIRLRGCAGWSAPVLLANLLRQVFSHRGDIHLIVHMKWKNQEFWGKFRFNKFRISFPCV